MTKAKQTTPHCSADQRAATATPHLNTDSGQNTNRTAAKIVRRIKRNGVHYAVRLCKNCGGEFEREEDGQRQDFGSKECRAEYLKRRQQRGLLIIDTALRWRGDRKDLAALGELCQMISLMLDQDRSVGRSSW